MANERKGTVPCRFCPATAEVKSNVKAKLYYVCPSCGIVQPTGATFQSWMVEHSTLDAAPAASPPPPAPTPQPAPEPAPPPKRKSFSLLD